MVAVNVGKKPGTPATPAAGKGKAAAAKGTEKKKRTAKAKPVVSITLDENNIPNIANEDGALIVGISGKEFFKHLTAEQKKDKQIRHLAKARQLEYLKYTYEYKLAEHNEKKSPKKKLLDKHAKLMAQLAALNAELGVDAADVPEVAA